MKKVSFKEALKAFANPFHEFTVEPLTEGLINQSYKITSLISGYSFLLQQINQEVFKDPRLVQQNYETIWHWLKDKAIDFRIPEPKQFSEDTTLFCDSEKNYWRVFEFIPGTKTLTEPETADQAGAVAGIFGHFTSSFNGFDTGRLAITIPDFHNLSFRYKQFTTSVRSHHYDRLLKAAPVVNALQKRERYVNLFDVFTESAAFPKRVIHHDAKIGNVLFEADSGKPVCAVDFDTTMPGYFFSDLGDMIRSMAASANENDTNIDTITIRKDYYEAIISGYLEQMNDWLTEAEKKYIHYAGLLIIYMQSLRFITDYLNGDMYYKISYPEQNFERARNQLQLLGSLEVFLAEVHGIKR